MAMRNYTIDAPPAQAEDAPVSAEPGFSSREGPGHTKPPVFACVFLLTILFVGLCICSFIAYRRFSGGMGSSRELAEAVSLALDDFTYEGIVPYLPPKLKDAGFFCDTDEFAEFRRMDAENGYSLEQAVIVNEMEIPDTDALSQGLFSIYGKKIPVSAAKLFQMSLQLRDACGSRISASANLAAVKVHGRWYLYAGPEDGLGSMAVPLFVFQATQEVSVEEPVSETDIAYADPVPSPEAAADPEEDVPSRELDFYDGARDDLFSGKFFIGSEKSAFGMPDALSAFEAFFVLDETASPGLPDIILQPDETLGNLPLSFADGDTVPAFVSVTAGNLSGAPAPVPECSVTDFFIGCPDEGVPLDVFLPGNVSFGTAISDFTGMYGEMDIVFDPVFKGTRSDTVYALPLQNPNNKIYFGFRDGRLLEIQWHYTDMTNYNTL